MIFGGEGLEVRRLEDWYLRHRDDLPALTNMYGITETTVHVSHFRLERDRAIASAGSLIGRRYLGTRGSTFWTVDWSLCLRGFAGSFTLRVGVWRGAMWDVPG